MNSLDAFFGIIITLFIAIIVYARRSVKVLEERRRICEIIHFLSSKDFEGGYDWEWRLRDFEKITFWNMLVPFWIPVESFFQDCDCILPRKEESHETDLRR